MTTKIPVELSSTPSIVDNGDATAITIDSSERVGIGTTSPTSKLHVKVGTNNNFEIEETGGDLRLLAINDARDANVAMEFAASQYDFLTGNATFSGHLTIDNPSADRKLAINRTGGKTFSIEHDTTSFYIYNVTDSSLHTKFTNGGDVLVGKSSTTFSTAGIRLGSNGNTDFTRNDGNVVNFNRTTSNGSVVEFYKDGSSVGSISTNSNSLPSDRNFKRDIIDLDLGLDLIKKLQPTQYNYKIDSEDCPKMYGLIAQDLEQALEEVGVEKNSTWLLQHEPKDDENQSDYALDYQKLTPILIKAIQEQQAIIEDLQTQINEVKNGN